MKRIYLYTLIVTLLAACTHAETPSIEAYMRNGAMRTEQSQQCSAMSQQAAMSDERCSRAEKAEFLCLDHNYSGPATCSPEGIENTIKALKKNGTLPASGS